MSLVCVSFSPLICSCVHYPVCVVAAVAVSPSSRSRLFFLHAPLPLHPPINLTLLFLPLLFASSLLSLLPSSFFLPDPLLPVLLVQRLSPEAYPALPLALALPYECTVPIWGWLVDDFLNIIMGAVWLFPCVTVHDSSQNTFMGKVTMHNDVEQSSRIPDLKISDTSKEKTTVRSITEPHGKCGL